MLYIIVVTIQVVYHFTCLQIHHL